MRGKRRRVMAGSPEAERKRALARERQKRRRALQRRGAIVVELIVEGPVRDSLVDLGELAGWDVENPAEVRATLQRLVDGIGTGNFTVLVTP